MTDDDLYPATDWLLRLFEAAERFEADVVHGPVVSRLPANRWYLEESEVFKRANPETGTVGTHIHTTANALFRRGLIEGVDEPFDPALALTGGEDTRFFGSLRDRGCRMIWCREAVVSWEVPPERSNLRFVLRRQFRNGNVQPRILQNVPLVRTFGYVARCSIRSALRGTFAVLTGLPSQERRRRGVQTLVTAAMQAAYACGVLAYGAGVRFEEYRQG